MTYINGGSQASRNSEGRRMIEMETCTREAASSHPSISGSRHAVGNPEVECVAYSASDRDSGGLQSPRVPLRQRGSIQSQGFDSIMDNGPPRPGELKLTPRTLLVRWTWVYWPSSRAEWPNEEAWSSRVPYQGVCSIPDWNVWACSWLPLQKCGLLSQRPGSVDHRHSLSFSLSPSPDI